MVLLAASSYRRRSRVSEEFARGISSRHEIPSNHRDDEARYVIVRTLCVTINVVRTNSNKKSLNHIYNAIGFPENADFRTIQETEETRFKSRESQLFGDQSE